MATPTLDERKSGKFLAWCLTKMRDRVFTVPELIKIGMKVNGPKEPKGLAEETASILKIMATMGVLTSPKTGSFRVKASKAELKEAANIVTIGDQKQILAEAAKFLEKKKVIIEQQLEEHEAKKPAMPPLVDYYTGSKASDPSEEILKLLSLGGAPVQVSAILADWAQDNNFVRALKQILDTDGMVSARGINRVFESIGNRMYDGCVLRHIEGNGSQAKWQMQEVELPKAVAKVIKLPSEPMSIPVVAPVVMSEVKVERPPTNVFADMDRFIAECCVKGSDEWVPSGALHQTYTEWLQANNLVNSLGDISWFGQEMGRRGFPAFKRQGVRGRLGINIKPEPEVVDTKAQRDIGVTARIIEPIAFAMAEIGDGREFDITEILKHAHLIPKYLDENASDPNALTNGLMRKFLDVGAVSVEKKTVPGSKSTYWYRLQTPADNFLAMIADPSCIEALKHRTRTIVELERIHTILETGAVPQPLPIDPAPEVVVQPIMQTAPSEITLAQIWQAQLDLARGVKMLFDMVDNINMILLEKKGDQDASDKG